MKENPDIDELLNSFIDGELAAGQISEVERLVARDENIAQRLRELQKCKMLLGSLPRAEAPAEVLQEVKASLSGGTLVCERPAASDEQAGTRRLPIRRLASVAAMIALAAVLTAVIYTTVGPETVPYVAGQIEPGAKVAAASEFSGRLELKTSALVAVDAFINSAIEDNGLSASVVASRRQDKRVYSLNCSKKGLDMLLADLEDVWDEIDLAKLSVDTEVFAVPAVVDAVTTEQIAEIVDQDNPERRIEVARDFAALNSIAEHMPGKEIMAAVDGGNRSLMTIPKPLLTGERQATTRSVGQPEDKKTVRLTIIVKR